VGGDFRLGVGYLRFQTLQIDEALEIWRHG
jgi:hypothetical protein